MKQYAQQSKEGHNAGTGNNRALDYRVGRIRLLCGEAHASQAYKRTKSAAQADDRRTNAADPNQKKEKPGKSTLLGRSGAAGVGRRR